ncbi:hypothetical protein FGW37_17215 [Streptomyces rectiverticillatus]|uniref:hypothetical protein n=1 Tax=Streptomyces rectiverticillatus TaxID=173860 RepID=UPI0015C2C781|nr:hypothetical protein [Streptomyces rectiverticillatus]QLE73100.1 hypothetical protein FGW37_17215 [Streptomyces rectiverticillatus]
MPEEPRRAGRRGRPWGPLQGGTAEINELARLLRHRLDAAGVTLGELYDQLTPDHFSIGHAPPARSTLARRLSGDGLERDWEIVEAIIDVTSNTAAEIEVARRQAQQLWEAARRNPAPAPPDADATTKAAAGDEVDAPAAAPVSFQGATFHGDVHITNNHYTGEETRQQQPDGEALIEAQRQVIDLQRELLASHRRLLEVADRLNHSHLALATVMRVLDEAPSSRVVDGLRREVAEALQQSAPEEAASALEALHRTGEQPAGPGS